MPHETPTQPRDARAPEPPRGRGPRRPAASTLAAFELLASPETIAGDVPCAEAPTGGRRAPAEAEIARLRADLDRQASELEALRKRLEVSPTATGDVPSPERVRLDLAAAHRLAEEAHRRERATRAALAAERAALKTADTISDPPSIASPTTSAIEAEPPDTLPRGWKTLAIAKTPPPPTEAREGDGGILRQTLHEHAQSLADRDRRLAEAEAGLAATHEEIARLQRELAAERRERSAVDEILRRLRHALTRMDAQSGDLDAGAPNELAPSSPAAGTLEASTMRFEPLPATDAEDGSASRDPAAWSEPIRPAVFEVWRDAQIRRHLGPLGIDSLVDLVRMPLARRARFSGAPIRILLIGRGAWAEAARLASGLVQRERSPFRLHVADPFEPEADGARALGHESPLLDLIEPFPLPPTPEALASRLVSLEPELLVSSQFLSAQKDPADWLEVFEGLRARGQALIFAERTGAPLPPRSSEIAKIGERIWARMPDRYKRRLDSETLIPSWREALEASGAMHANGCLAALRARFELELFAPFGHLAEPFIGSAVGSRFSVGAPRDLRFLMQVADVDDRQIEAGIAPALHFVALVDPAAPSGAG